MISSSLLLAGLGLISIYSSSLGKGVFLNFEKQIIFLVIGFFLMMVISFFDWKMLRDSPYFILIVYFFCILALAGLFFFAPKTRGISGWYKFGDVSFDPIELMKIILIVLLAKYFSTRHVEMYRLVHILLSGFYVLFPSFLIFLQPNLGSALILVVLWVGVLVISGIKLRHFLILVLCGLLVLVVSWSFLIRDYQKERITSFLNPQLDPKGASWSQNQARIAIGSGGIFGQGITKGSQTKYGFLPEPHTDFIFASIAEEMGLIGTSILFLSFVVLIWRIMKISISATSNFPRLFASGFSIVIISQILINVGMNIGIMPVIGISLPLVSYGGSSLIATYIGLGILNSIKTH
jgi:rod shape determining protein RodA